MASSSRLDNEDEEDEEEDEDEEDEEEENVFDDRFAVWPAPPTAAAVVFLLDHNLATFPEIHRS